ncbi:MAG: hypothetical protein P1U70_20940, partial [Saprospiraceae bacterium]|nr:hypothetical protein [Saprospiraceae bacterium]
MKNLIFSLLAISLFSIKSQAQIAINEDNSQPDVSAILDVKSSTKGVLIPRMTSTDRGNITSPATGLLVYDTTTKSFWFYSGSWKELNSGSITDADVDTKIQVEETSDEDKIRFDIAGTEHFKMSAGRLEVLNTGFSVFIGEGAGTNDDLTNNKNVFIGYQAGNKNTTGYNNIFFSHEAGYNNTTGHQNIFLGALSGFLNTTGNNNVFLGRQSGYSNTTGSGNIFLGTGSGT